MEDSLPDGVLILHAYARWGVGCVLRLLGDFSFTIWDGRENRLLCARDFVGVRPLYFGVSGTQFAFANDIPGVLAAGDLGVDIDLRTLHTQIHFSGKMDQERTLLVQVRKLPPAHYMLVSSGGVRVERYWDPRAVPQVHLDDDQSYLGRLRELIENAVTCRLRSSRPIGAHASGGLDSSAIAVLAARALHGRGERLTAISWAPPPKLDEPLKEDQATVEAIAKAEDIDTLFVPMTSEDLADDMCADQGLHARTTLRWKGAASRAAAARGIGVVLSGWGGDEFAAFNGRGYFSSLFLRGRWVLLARELRMRAALHKTHMWGIRTKIILPLLSDAVVDRFWPHHGMAVGPPPSALSAELREALGASKPGVWSPRERPDVRRV